MTGCDSPTHEVERSPRSLRVAVVGAGSWGTALAHHAARSGHTVRLWGRHPERVARMAADRRNNRYLPQIKLHELVTPTSDAAVALQGAELVLSVVPSKFLRGTWQQLAQLLPDAIDVVSATKGIEPDSGLRMTEVLATCIGDRARLSALSGPSFALELAQGQPTAVTLGCLDASSAERVQRALSHGPLRVYRNSDLVGVELGGALKNVIALAAGISDGLGLGTNTRAGLICRGLKEMSVLAAALGGQPQTLAGLAGLGDLVLTCTGPLSRNRQVGLEVGGGRSLAEVTAGMSMVAEGVVTVTSARQVADRHGVELPITNQVYDILHGGKDPRTAIDELLARALVEE